MNSHVLAILVSDIHFSHVAPIVRSTEPDWFAAQERQWMEVWELFRVHGNPPVVIAGDIFDRWNTPVECVNKVISLLGNFVTNGRPNIYAIPGQHDLPGHRWDQRERSAYFTLVQAGVVFDLYRILTVKLKGGNSLTFHPFWWGKEIQPLDDKYKGDESNLNLAVCHSYIWTRGCGYPGADEQKLVGHFRDNLAGYDAAVFGDNHKSFISHWQGRSKEVYLMNCGTFYRRKSDEIDYHPQIGLLMDSGEIKSRPLDTSKDIFFCQELRSREDQNEFSELMDVLRELGPDSLDFRQTLNRVMDERQSSPAVREMVLDSLG